MYLCYAQYCIIVLVNHRKKNSWANHLNPPMNRIGIVLLCTDYSDNLSNIDLLIFDLEITIRLMEIGLDVWVMVQSLLG